MSAEKAEAVVAGHICLDIIPALGERTEGLGEMFSPGNNLFVGPAEITTGGTVPNTGLAMHRLGIRTRLAGRIGDDAFGRTATEILRSHGAHLADHLILAPGERTSHTFVISPPGVDRILIHHSGANDNLAADDIGEALLAGARLFHFGYPPSIRNMYSGGGEEMARMLAKARAAGLTVTLDMSQPDAGSEAGRVDWIAWLKRVLPLVDVFLPSFEETLFMLDRARFDRFMKEHGRMGLIPAADGELLRELTGRLVDFGAAAVVLKLGDQGICVRTTDDSTRITGMGGAAPKDVDRWTGREFIATCFVVDVVGTTGAGDSTIGGFLTGLLKGFGPEEAAEAALATGASCVEKRDPVSGIPGWDELYKRIKSGWARRTSGLSLTGWNHTKDGFYYGPDDTVIRNF